MKYQVTITEIVTETRLYEVEADSPKSAAEQVSAMWLDSGIEPEDGADVAVTERDYEVFEKGAYVEHFSCSDIEVE